MKFLRLTSVVACLLLCFSTLTAAKKITAVAVHPKDENFVAIGHTDELKIWNKNNCTSYSFASKNPISRLEFSPDGSLLVIQDSKSNIRIMHDLQINNDNDNSLSCSKIKLLEHDEAGLKLFTFDETGKLHFVKYKDNKYFITNYKKQSQALGACFDITRHLGKNINLQHTLCPSKSNFLCIQATCKKIIESTEEEEEEVQTNLYVFALSPTPEFKDTQIAQGTCADLTYHTTYEEYFNPNIPDWPKQCSHEHPINTIITTSQYYICLGNCTTLACWKPSTSQIDPLRIRIRENITALSKSPDHQLVYIGTEQGNIYKAYDHAIPMSCILFIPHVHELKVKNLKF